MRPATALLAPALLAATPIAALAYPVSVNSCNRAVTFAAAPTRVHLLDEPTSALDPATEAALVKALLAARRDACIVASIHRPQLLDAFDEVLVVNAGRVVDQGTPAELQPRCPELATFLRLDPRAGVAVAASPNSPARSSGSAGSAGPTGSNDTNGG